MSDPQGGNGAEPKGICGVVLIMGRDGRGVQIVQMDPTSNPVDRIATRTDVRMICHEVLNFLDSLTVAEMAGQVISKTLQEEAIKSRLKIVR